MPRDTITVTVVSMGRKVWYLRWVDPTTGKRTIESSGCTNKKAAWEVAIRRQDELNANRMRSDGSGSWAKAEELFVEQHLEGLAENSITTYLSTFEMFRRVIRPRRLGDVTAARLSQYVAARRKGLPAREVAPDQSKLLGKAVRPASEDTVLKDLRHLRAFLSWCVEQGYLPAVPNFPRINRTRKGQEARGRALTVDEFQRVLAAADIVTGCQSAHWRHYLEGLWLSGLRLSESLCLRWERGNWISVDRTDSRGRWKLWIPGSFQKSGKDQQFPLTPDFVEFLQGCCPADGRGFVFNPTAVDGRRYKGRADVGRTISAIGEASGVIVDEQLGRTMTAHDLRRSYGDRWSRMVRPVQLQKLMRHETIQTTMRYYVSAETDSIQDDVYAAFSLNQQQQASTGQGPQTKTSTVESTPQQQKSVKP